MKIFQKLSFLMLSSSFLLAGVGMISLKGNEEIKTNLDRVILQGDNTKNSLEDLILYSSQVEAKSYHYFLQQKSGVPDVYLQKDKEEILNLFPKLSEELSNLDNYTENAFQLELDFPTDRNKLRANQIQLIRTIDKLEQSQVKVKEIVNKLLENEVDEAENQILATQLRLLYKEEIYPLLQEYQDNFTRNQNQKTQIITNYIDNNNLAVGNITIVALTISLVLGLYAAYRISRPIEQLKAAALLVGEGNLNVLVPEIKDDEMGILIKTFNDMISGLKNTTVSKSYLDKILTSMGDSLIVIDPDGTIRKVNSATCRLLGYEEKELIGQNIAIILGDSFLTIDRLSQKTFLENYDVTYLTKKQQKIPIAFSSSIIQNDRGQTQGIVCLGKDITEKKESEKALKESEERYALASRAANDGLWDWNLVSNQIYFSPRWKSLLGYEEEAFGNTPDRWFKLIHPNYRDLVSQAIINHLQNPISHLEISYPILHNDRSYRWMLCRGIAVQNDRGEIIRLTGSQTDITQSRLDKEKLRQQALYDGLTCLPNRSFFMEKLKTLFESSKRSSDRKFAILFVDLDGFKKINDSLGHLVGDRLLVSFTNRVKECLRIQDTFARLGGDEFAILAENIQTVENATNLAGRIFQQLEKPFSLEGRELFVSASIGIAPYNSKYFKIEDMLRDADTAMYRAKGAGKARYEVFRPEMHLEALSVLELENDLRRAIKREEFKVFYQPIVQLATRQIVGFEALIRWQHPSKGNISPGKFIPIAEETGLIVPIGNWVMEQACRQMRQWQERYRVARDMTISVNVSPIQLKQFYSNDFTDCLDRLKEICSETGLEPECLKLEITESTVVESFDKASKLLKEIKGLGIKLSMDDFGTGYSSLNSLHRLPIDTLKIDRSFINELGVNKDKLQLTQTIVSLAQNMNLDVIAEGIETTPQQALLTELNCEYGQGYLFSKPVNSKDAEILIATMEQFSRRAPLHPSLN